MTAPTVDATTDDPNNQEYTGGMVALIPADPYPHALAVPGGLPPEQLHLTLAYLGDDVTDWDPELRAAVLDVIREITGDFPPDGDMTPDGPGTRGPLTMTVFAHSHFNPTGADGREPCMVYQFGGDGDLNMVQYLADDVKTRIKDAIGDVNFPEQHPRFEPHITAGYGLAPDALSYVGPVVFDRIRIALAGDHIDVQLGTGGTVTAAAPTAPPTTKVPTAPDAPPPVVVKDTGDTITVRWPALAVEGMDTGDGRYLQPGGGKHRALPLSLLALPYKAHGGGEPPAAEVFGQVTELDYQPGPEVARANGEPFPDGTFVWGATAEIDGTHEYADLVRKGYLRGGSIDIAELDATLIEEEDAAMSGHPNRRAVFHTYEIAAATMVPVPAFADAYCQVVDSLPEAVAASGLPAGMRTDPAPMARPLGADELCWDCLGDFADRTPSGAVSADKRQRAKANKNTLPGTDSFPIENCADARNAVDNIGRAGKEQATVRKYIISQVKKHKCPPDVIPDHWNSDGTVKKQAMTAAGVAGVPPIEWFRDPQLDGPTPLTVTDDGQVFGHLAVWGAAHISYPHRRVTPPRSHSDYAYFHTGSVKVLDGVDNPVLISAGHIALDTGHATMTADAAAASAHYDNTGSIVADVCAGEDAHGIWVAGAVTPTCDDLKLHKLRSCGLSGDWRRIGTGLELVAAISVPTPGFPVPRARVASGQPMALVAAGALLPPQTPGAVVLDYDTLADALADRLDARARRRAQLTQQQASLLADLAQVPDGATRMAALLADLADGGDDSRPEGGGRDELRELGLTDAQIDAFDISSMPPQLQKSYIGGKAAAKIGWGSEGDFDRCVAEARHHGIPARMRKGMCATLHKKATGKAPGKH